MGVIRELGTDRRVRMRSPLLVGRHPVCDLHLTDPRVSGEHACLSWYNTLWELRDLGSKNGTFVDGRHIGKGERVALQEGATILFGCSEALVQLDDASPPEANARNERTGSVRWIGRWVLALPDADAPEVCVYDAGCGWVVEEKDGFCPVKPRDVVVAGGDRWQLDVPVAFEGLHEGPFWDRLTVRVGASRDDRRVEATLIASRVRWPGHDKAFALPEASHRLLVVLARARRDDAAATRDEGGWVERDRLCRMLGIDFCQLAYLLSRLHRDVGALLGDWIGSVIAREWRTGALRLGTHGVEVSEL